MDGLSSGSEGTKNAKIIIVDDDQSIASVFSKVLKRAGYNVMHTFPDGKDFLDHVDELHRNSSVNGNVPNLPALVLVDYRMKRLDGVETAKALRSKFPSVKIILISAYEPPVETLEYYDAHLRKPVTMSDLLQTVSRVLNS